jgi:hypothetical protein
VYVSDTTSAQLLKALKDSRCIIIASSRSFVADQSIVINRLQTSTDKALSLGIRVGSALNRIEQEPRAFLHYILAVASPDM